MPVVVFYFLLHNQSNLKNESFESMFGGLYKTLNLNRTDRYMFNVAFLARRLMYALSIGTFFTDITMLNVLLQILMSIMLSVYLAHSKPFEEKKDNFIEIMNELTILFVLYLTLGLITNDALLSGEERYTIGYVMIGLILLNIAVNFAIFLYTTVFEVIRAVKKLL